MRVSVDHHLNQLRAARTPPSLETVEDGVIAAIGDQARQRATGRTIGRCSVLAALALGLAGGTALTRPVSAATSPIAIGADIALAPSTLLLGEGR